MGDQSGVKLSLPASEQVRGYTIRRLPLGEYLRAAQALSDSPKALLDACFPGESASAAMARLRRIDADGLADLLARAMTAAPREAIRLVAALTGVPEDALMNDPGIGLDGAAQMMEAFWRLNGVENFIRAARSGAAQLRALRSGTGCSA